MNPLSALQVVAIGPRDVGRAQGRGLVVARAGWGGLAALIVGLFILGIGYALRANGQEVAHTSLTAFLILLAAIFPALTVAAIGNRQLRFPRWPTTW